jgi:hypothetical protein
MAKRGADMAELAPIKVEIEDEADLGDEIRKELALIRERIVHALEIFPFLSSSAIHQAIGTGTATALWRPLLMKLVAEGTVCKTEVIAQTPLNRTQTYHLYHLATRTYEPYSPSIRATQITND